MPEDPRERFFFVILMPLNEEGQGPASPGEIAKITFEVWNQFLDTVFSSEFLPEAIYDCEKRNKEHYNVS